MVVNAPSDARRQFRRERRRARRQKTVNLLPSMLTLGNVMCGLLSMVATMEGDFARAAWLVVLGGIFDLTDGRVARITHSVSDFGKQLDSLSDIITFGVAPALLVYRFFGFYMPGISETSLHRLSLAALLMLPCAGTVRLARFNITPSDHRRFIGLPIPAAAGTLVSFTLVAIEYPNVKGLASSVAMPLTVLLSFLMVSDVRYPKSGLFRVPRKAVPMYLFLFSSLVYLFLMDRSLMLLGIGVSYTSFGLLNKLLRGRIALPAMRDTADAPDAPGEHTPSHA